MTDIVTGTYLECNHLVAAIDADKPCPVCAKIKVAREGNHQETLECLKMARKEGREEVLELACKAIGSAGFNEEGIPRSNPEVAIRQAYKERFHEQG